MEEFRRFAPATELEGGSKEERRLEEGDRGGHSPKTCRSALKEEEAIRQPLLYLVYCYMSNFK